MTSWRHPAAHWTAAVAAVVAVGLSALVELLAAAHWAGGLETSLRALERRVASVEAAVRVYPSAGPLAPPGPPEGPP